VERVQQCAGDGRLRAFERKGMLLRGHSPGRATSMERAYRGRRDAL
jgi:hypothetical protein